MFKLYPFRWSNCFWLVLMLVGCSLPKVKPTPAAVTPEPVFSNTSERGIRFINLIDGGTIDGSLDEQGRAQVIVKVEVSGVLAEEVTLTANGFGVEDSAMNPEGQVPLITEIIWKPMNGGGEYDLMATATLNDKSEITRMIHITVTGVPALPPTPPPLDEAGARQRISELVLQDYGVSIPSPTVFRFDSPYYPYLSRWIGSAWYQGQRHYVDLYDDGRALWSSGPYTDQEHPQNTDTYMLCKPAGHYKVLVLFVDYASLLVNPQAALAAVPRVADWMNEMYADFALSQGLSTSPLSIEAEAAFVGPPPVAGEALTAEQVHSLTGKDPEAYDFLMEIDFDPQITFAERYFPGLLIPGGGVALQGCGTPPFGAINIWSSLPDDTQIEGALVMDFNHELSHLFGLVDNWPIQLGFFPGPSGQDIDNWIPYPMLGWTDVDGDGIIEILDPTPYGTDGPQP